MFSLLVVVKARLLHKQLNVKWFRYDNPPTAFLANGGT